jgi:hypothetical protein
MVDKSSSCHSFRIRDEMILACTFVSVSCEFRRLQFSCDSDSVTLREENISVQDITLPGTP